jgi:hypothetical protein
VSKPWTQPLLLLLLLLLPCFSPMHTLHHTYAALGTRALSLPTLSSSLLQPQGHFYSRNRAQRSARLCLLCRSYCAASFVDRPCV